MTKLRIRHTTAYTYEWPVTLLAQRLMLRPRESPELRLIGFEVATSPPSEITWAHDVFGNAVATAQFQTPTQALTITSVSQVELTALAWPVFEIAASAASFPFLYSQDEWVDLGGLRLQQYLDEGGQLRCWAEAFVLGPVTDTLSLLRDLSEGVSARITYETREAEGTQSPQQSLARGTGSCRDIALLFIEAARSLGFGARIVSGYLHAWDANQVGSAFGGSTHAWAEVYIPGAGWITFDPTNRSLGGANLIPVAVGRDIHQVAPVSGGFLARLKASGELKVEVTVEPYVP